MIIIYHYDDYTLNRIVTKMVSFAEKCARLLAIFSPTWSLTSPPVSTASTGSDICISCDAMLTPRIWYTFNRFWRRWSWWVMSDDSGPRDLINKCFTSWRVFCGGLVSVCGLCEGTFERSPDQISTYSKRAQEILVHPSCIDKELWKCSKYLSSVTNKHHVSKETLSLKI